MNFPIYVASKGRPHGATFAGLNAVRLAHHTVVEPQDEAGYAEAGHRHLLVLDASDRGLVYARQAALEHARATGADWYWMLDDDLDGYGRTDALHGRNQPIAADVAMGLVETLLGRLADPERMGVLAMEHGQYAWNARAGQVAWDSYCDAAVLINSAADANYRQGLPLKGDRDFVLQVLAAGLHTARLRDVSFRTAAIGHGAGGSHQLYEHEQRASLMMEELWPDVCRAVIKRNGRPDVAIDWRRAAAQAQVPA